MKNNTDIPAVAGSRAKVGLLRCVCPFCGEPHFHANAGPHPSQCKNPRLVGTYRVVADSDGSQERSPVTVRRPR